MGKEIRNIHLHIIAEDYHTKKKEELQFDVTGKSDSLGQLLQNNKSIVKQLEKMHLESSSVTELQFKKTEQLNKSALLKKSIQEKAFCNDDSKKH